MLSNKHERAKQTDFSLNENVQLVGCGWSDKDTSQFNVIREAEATLRALRQNGSTKATW